MSAAPASALVVGAHPDDGDLGCGATLARWTAAGCSATSVVVTDGSKGSHDPDLPDAVLRDRREAEQREAATVLGVGGVRFLRRVDGELREEPALVDELTAAIRELRPEVVLTHDPLRADELHPDHPVTGRLVLAALFAAREPRAARELAARGLAPWRPRALLLWRPQQPDHVEALDEEALARKTRALLCHRSQLQTSFGLTGDEDPADVAARLRPWHDDGAGGLVERFRRLELPGWTRG